jgi:hypothetical protein
MNPNSDHMKNVVMDELIMGYFKSVNDPAYTKWLFNTTLSTLRPARQPLSLVFTRAGFIKRTLGTRVAAGYLRNRSVSIETALYLLTRKGN